MLRTGFFLEGTITVSLFAFLFLFNRCFQTFMFLEIKKIMTDLSLLFMELNNCEKNL